MTDPGSQDQAARAPGLALHDASSVYEDYVIPTFEGRLRKRPFPPHRRAVLGLAGRQRRLLHATYKLADNGMALEAIGPLRSMFEFLVTQLWIAKDPDRNVRHWLDQGRRERELLEARLRGHAPALLDAALESLTPEQQERREEVNAAAAQLSAELEGAPGVPRKLEQRAREVGLSMLYDVLYRYQSAAGPHPTMQAVDLLLDKHPRGLILRAGPTAQFGTPPVYLHGAYLLHSSLQASADLNPALSFPELQSLGREIHTLMSERATAQVPNWEDLRPPG